MSTLAISSNHISSDHIANAVVINEEGSDVDFRVESDTDANCLFVDAGNSRVGINTAAPTVALDVTGAVTISGTLTASGGVGVVGTFVVNEAGAAATDFRVESDTMANAIFVDSSADLVLFTDAATGGTAPTAPTGGYTTTGGVTVVIQNNTATSDLAILALIGGATTGASGIDLGDANDSDAGQIRYAHATDLLTLVAGTVTTVGTTATEVTINEAGSATVDFRVESDTMANAIFVDSSADLILFTDAATGGTPPAAPTGGYTTTGGVFFVVQNNSATSDSAIVSLVGGATTGTCAVNFGDSGDADIGNISYAHATDTFTITAGTVAVQTVSSVAVTTATGISTTKTPVTLTLADGANTDFALPAGTNFYSATPTMAHNVTGFTGGVAGRMIYIFNNTGQNLTWTHQATSAAANQITTSTGADVASTANSMSTLIYNGTTSKWLLFGHQA